MKDAIDSQLEAFDAVFDFQIVVFLLKRLLSAFVPLCIAFFLASRIPWKFLRDSIASAGFLWAYIVFLISLGFVCRAVVIKYIRKQTLDIQHCAYFSISFAPAYLFIPFIMIVLGAILRIISFLLLYSGLIPYVGEIILGILIVPIVLIGVVSSFFFVVGIYFAPAVIASEEEGLTFVFRRVISFINYIPIHFLLYSLVGIIFAGFLTSVFLGLVAEVFFVLFPVVASVLKLKMVTLGYALGGSFISSLVVREIPFTCHIFAFLAYISLGILISLTLAIPTAFICSSSVHLYKLLRAKEIFALEMGTEPLLNLGMEKIAYDNGKRVCPHCKESVKAQFMFCTQCGKPLEGEKALKADDEDM